MSDSFLEKALESNLLFSPIVIRLIKNFSFKFEFLNSCLSHNFEEKVVFTWKDLKLFFESNYWNWDSFILNNFDTILHEFGFIRLASIDLQSLPKIDLDNLIKCLNHFTNSKIVFDYEMLAYLTTENNNLINNQNNSQSSSTIIINEKNNDTNQTINTKIETTSNFTKINLSSTVTIWTFNLMSKQLNMTTSYYNNYFTSRFYLLDKFLDKYYQDLKNKPQKPLSIKEIEINERIFISGIIIQTSLSSADLYSTRLHLINCRLNCSIIASISIQQQFQVPTGLVIGIIGKVTDILNMKNNELQVFISSESWFFPGIFAPTKKQIPKNTNQSWVAVIGSINYSKNSTYTKRLMNQFVKWVRTIHENFRLSYCIFAGGILSSSQFEYYSKPEIDKKDTFNSLRSDFTEFNLILENFPSNIETFVVPSIGDFTTQYLPQSPISTKFCIQKDNIHYLQNPNYISLEGKELLIYNPFQFLSFEPFKDHPEKFCIDLLNFRHLSPVWLENQNVCYPSSQDSLIIREDIDFFIINHPKQNFMSNYKNITLLGVSSNYDNQVSEFQILLFNLHTQERKIVKIQI